MNYPEFETSFEAQFQIHTDSYPNAVGYYRARFDQTIQYLLSSILEQTETLIQQSKRVGHILKKLSATFSTVAR